jgi:hypothetical protein
LGSHSQELPDFWEQPLKFYPGAFYPLLEPWTLLAIWWNLQIPSQNLSNWIKHIGSQRKCIKLN